MFKKFRKEEEKHQVSIEEAKVVQKRLDDKEEYVDRKYLELLGRLKRNRFEEALRQAFGGGGPSW